jgi:hypothetical protein
MLSAARLDVIVHPGQHAGDRHTERDRQLPCLRERDQLRATAHA